MIGIMKVIHIIDVTDAKDQYTIAMESKKSIAVSRGRELVEQQGMKIDIYDGLNRFKTVKLR